MEGLTVRELINELEGFGDDLIVGWTDSKRGVFRTIDNVDTATEDGELVVELAPRWLED